MRTLGLMAALLLCAVGLITGCAPDKPKADLLYQVFAADGGAASADQMRRVENELDTRLQGAGYERRNVTLLGADKIRISLPEAVGSKVPEICKMLEAGQFWSEAKVKLTRVIDG